MKKGTKILLIFLLILVLSVVTIITTMLLMQNIERKLKEKII